MRMLFIRATLHSTLHSTLLCTLLCTALGLGGVMLSAPSFAEISKSEAAAKAKGKHGGKVLSVTKVSSKNGKSTYKVKLLLDGGKVKTVVISG